ncbi:MAG: DUF5658 family protein [Desulfobacterales bacterium]
MQETLKRKDSVPADSCEGSSPERRCGKDRRQKNNAQFKYFLVNGRRELARRDEDKARYYFFDRYNQRMFAAITVILMLSIFDALLTLILIERGSSELNPVMAYFLDHGPLPFIIAKYLLTSFGVLVLLIFKNVFLNRINMHTHSLFACVIFAFSTVIVWELFLLFSAR